MTTIIPRQNNVFDAIKDLDLDAVKYFVEKDENLVKTAKDDLQKSVALVAAERGNFQILKYVLEKDNSNLTDIDNLGNDIMQRSIERSALETVKYLVKHQQWSITRKNFRRHGNTPIHHAAKEGELDILKYFIEEERSYPEVLNDVGNTPLFLAAETPHMNVVKYLVEEQNVNVTAINYYRENILFKSAEQGDVILPKYLLDERKEKFDVNWRNKRYQTIVFVAVKYNELEFLEYVVDKKGAEVNIPEGEKGMTPLHVAAYRNNHKICHFLVEREADIKAVDNSGKKPMQLATDTDLIKFLEYVESKRSRRSVPEVLVSYSRPRVDRMLLKKLDTENIFSSNVFLENNERPRTPFFGISSSRFESFLMLADTVVKYYNRNSTIHRQRAKHLALFSPGKIDERRIDPVALDIVNNFYDFE